MLNPHELNRLSAPSDSRMVPDASRIREFPLIWYDPDPDPPPWAPPRTSPRVINPAFENLRGAREEDRFGVELPVAVYPTYVHPRLRAQRSCFTIHGKRKEGLHHLLADSILIDPASRDAMLGDLRLLGVTDSVTFPDLDGLASELTTQFL
jgi:hypothetical protein